MAPVNPVYVYVHVHVHVQAQRGAGGWGILQEWEEIAQLERLWLFRSGHTDRSLKSLCMHSTKVNSMLTT